MAKSLFFIVAGLVPSFASAVHWVPGAPNVSCKTRCASYNYQEVSSGVSEVGEMYVCRALGIEVKTGYQTQSHPHHGPGTCTVGHGGDEIRITTNYDCLCH